MIRGLRITGLALIMGTSASAQVIRLERSECFGICPAYLVQIESSGIISFRQGPPSNRRPERTARITPEQFGELLTGFDAIRFQTLSSSYSPESTDGQQTSLELTRDGQKKRVAHFENGPAKLIELERKIELLANIHQWLHPKQRKTLGSPMAGVYAIDGEDLKVTHTVRQDLYYSIKPGMTPLMQAVGKGALELHKGDEVNATDETGWTALMFAAVAGARQSVLQLLKAGAKVDQRDEHGDTALIGAAAVMFDFDHRAADSLAALLANGAKVDAANELGETALMWAARTGNPEAIQTLLKAGAKPDLVDQAGHNAIYYLETARGAIKDPSIVERYDRAASILRP